MLAGQWHHIFIFKCMVTSAHFNTRCSLQFLLNTQSGPYKTLKEAWISFDSVWDSRFEFYSWAKAAVNHILMALATCSAWGHINHTYTLRISTQNTNCYLLRQREGQNMDWHNYSLSERRCVCVQCSCTGVRASTGTVIACFSVCKHDLAPVQTAFFEK